MCVSERACLCVCARAPVCVQWGKLVFDPLPISQVCPLAKKCVIYNCNGRSILTVRDRISSGQTCEIGRGTNTYFPHCMCVCVSVCGHVCVYVCEQVKPF